MVWVCLGPQEVSLWFASLALRASACGHENQLVVSLVQTGHCVGMPVAMEMRMW